MQHKDHTNAIVILVLDNPKVRWSILRSNAYCHRNVPQINSFLITLNSSWTCYHPYSAPIYSPWDKLCILLELQKLHSACWPREGNNFSTRKPISGVGDIAQFERCLPHMCKALNVLPSIAKLGLEVQAYNFSAREVYIEGLEVQSQRVLHETNKNQTTITKQERKEKKKKVPRCWSVPFLPPHQSSLFGILMHIWPLEWEQILDSKPLTE